MIRILIAALLFAGAAQGAEVTLKKAKCSLFGNIKVKVRGLDHGSLGRKYLEHNLKFFTNCDRIETEFHQSIGTGPYQVEAKKDTWFTQKQRGKGEKVRCKIYEHKKLSVVFADYPSLTFSRQKKRLHTKLNGPCPEL